jgi:hypothetical protein
VVVVVASIEVVVAGAMEEMAGTEVVLAVSDDWPPQAAPRTTALHIHASVGRIAPPFVRHRAGTNPERSIGDGSDPRLQVLAEEKEGRDGDGASCTSGGTRNPEHS